ncbi:hypothetical protein B9Z19DRAFT_1132130 [Tuber borchii]|uniref:Uncharacterized protein n=1 Tax=Tuber borchii TaxID=42251 RepID=A0A2T6ZHL3_TUBBO|nr:hypothetical protein B9Z19DRAFT_1132130 [Tuber borchii]
MAILDYVFLLKKYLAVHSQLVPNPLRSMHENMMRFFEKNYTAEIAALAPKDEEWKNIENLFTEEQLQLFEKGNGDLAKDYEDTLDQVRPAKKSLIEISSSQA